MANGRLGRHIYIYIYYALSISNLPYSEPGSPFPDCREGLTDRLSAQYCSRVSSPGPVG